MKYPVSLLLLPVVVAIQNWRGISIYGLETDHRGFVCDWVNPVDDYINQVFHLGFNGLRVPFSYQYIMEGDFSKLDHIVYLAGVYNMSVVLDLHRIWNVQQGYSPLAEGLSLESFIQSWFTVLDRYLHQYQVLVHNAYNEFKGSDPADALYYTEALFNAVEERYPGRYIHAATGSEWGGNLRGLDLEHLPFKDRIIYSIHKYPFSGDGSQHDWEESFGHLSYISENPDRFVVGEFGWQDHQHEWAVRFLSFLQEHNFTNTIYWTIAHSSDTGNLYDDNCRDIHWHYYDLLKRFWLRELL